MRKGDIKPAEKRVSVKLESPFDTRGKAFLLTPEKHRVETVPLGENPTGDLIAGNSDVIVNQEKGEVLSDTKELYRNLKKKIGWIDSPRTKAVYGFTGKEGEIALTDMSVDVKTDFATVAVSSLTNEPINSSDNLLLTAVGRAENTGSKYNEDRTVQLDPGHDPIQVEIIEAVFKIKTDKTKLLVI
jgi:hypothetical protein